MYRNAKRQPVDSADKAPSTSLLPPRRANEHAFVVAPRIWGLLGRIVFGCLLGCIMGMIGCARSPVQSDDQAMRVTNPPQLVDDLGLENLLEALEENRSALGDWENSAGLLKFGPRQISKRHYLKALDHLISLIKQDASGKMFYSSLSKDFEFFEVYGSHDWGEVFITSYFSPMIEGSLTRTDKFHQPLYSVPKDLVSIDMKAFMEAFPKLRNIAENTSEQKSSIPILRGRLVQNKVVPYYSRGEIDAQEQLEGRGLEIVWVDPVDAFFLQIQGSGIVRFDDGKEIRVGYAAQNGHSYVPIGKYLFDQIPKEEMSLQRIEAHLRSLSEDEMQALLDKNPSYVFFQPMEGMPQTYCGAEAYPGRSIATDRRYFPKGTLAFLRFEKPIFNSIEDIKPVKWVQSSRFVIDQDTGGAIRGPGRVDLYWGRGKEARQAAGVMKNPGRLYYIIPKESFYD